jgi:hypothetical protein
VRRAVKQGRDEGALVLPLLTDRRTRTLLIFLEFFLGAAFLFKKKRKKEKKKKCVSDCREKPAGTRT